MPTKYEKNRTKPGNPYYLVLFENRTKPGTVLSETVLSGDSLYLKTLSLKDGLHCTANVYRQTTDKLMLKSVISTVR